MDPSFIQTRMLLPRWPGPDSTTNKQRQQLDFLSWEVRITRKLGGLGLGPFMLKRLGQLHVIGHEPIAEWVVIEQVCSFSFLFIVIQHNGGYYEDKDQFKMDDNLR